jgi:hypothetical protein
MKLIKITSLFSLVGLLAFSSPQTVRAGTNSGFFFPPFGKVTLNGLFVEGNVKASAAPNGFPSGGDKHNFDTRSLMELCINAINDNEGSDFKFPLGGDLFFDGSDFLIRNPDGSTFLNLSDSPFGGDYLDMFFSNQNAVKVKESGHKFTETDEDDVQIVFNAHPSLSKTSISAQPEQFTLGGFLRVTFNEVNSFNGPLVNGIIFPNLTCSGKMRGFGSGFLENKQSIAIKWGGTIKGDFSEILSFPF